MKHLFFIIVFFALTLSSCNSNTVYSYLIQVKNMSLFDRHYEPVEINLVDLNLDAEQLKGIVSLTSGDDIVPFQMDDLNNDEIPDVLSFLCDLKGSETKAFELGISKNSNCEQILFENKTWAQLMLREDMKLKKNLTQPGGNLYAECFHHGPAFENEEVAYRVYFDKRMSIDAYGKKQNQLELKQTNWYSDSIQRKNNFGKDILWVGKTVSVGAIRGWNGEKATFINKVESRKASVIAYGPIRTMVAMESEGWEPNNQKVNIKSVFTLYAMHREFQHDLIISTDSISICTGLMKKDSAFYFKKPGVDGLWGFNLAEKTDAVADTFGLGVIVPEKYILESTEDKLNHLEILNTIKYQKFRWYGLAAWKNEENGFKDKEHFFSFLSSLKTAIDNPVELTIKKLK